MRAFVITVLSVASVAGALLLLCLCGCAAKGLEATARDVGLHNEVPISARDLMLQSTGGVGLTILGVILAIGLAAVAMRLARRSRTL